MSEWINVKERRPERGQRVLFIDKSIGAIYVGAYHGEGGGGAYMFMAFNRLTTANWWMPLPKPPKEEV